jgi:hypothetical protein
MDLRNQLRFPQKISQFVISILALIRIVERRETRRGISLNKQKYPVPEENWVKYSLL